MKGIVVYESKYGSTKAYAEEIGRETGFDVLTPKQVKKHQLEDSEVVVLGSWIFAGKPVIKKWITKKWAVLKDKKLLLFTTSGAEKDDPELMKAYEANMEPEYRDRLNYFPMGGRFAMDQLTGLDRFFMNLGVKMETDPEVKAEMTQTKDHVNLEHLDAVFNYLRTS